MNAHILSIISGLNQNKNPSMGKIVREVERKNILCRYEKLKKAIMWEAKHGSYHWGIQHTIAESHDDQKSNSGNINLK